MLLAIASKLGARSFGMHRLVVALIGAALVPLVALLGAEIGDWRVGIRLQRSGRMAAAVGLGVIVGLGALTRGELLLLVPVLVVPVCVARRDDGRARRLVLAGVATLVAALVIAPWTIYNFSRFEKPVLISTAVDTTLGGATATPCTTARRSARGTTRASTTSSRVASRSQWPRARSVRAPRATSSTT